LLYIQVFNRSPTVTRDCKLSLCVFVLLHLSYVPLWRELIQGRLNNMTTSRRQSPIQMRELELEQQIRWRYESTETSQINWQLYLLY
jgi:cytochrome c oxidase assembly protein Cox11